MAITLDITDGAGWADRALFEIMPRAGEIIHWPVAGEVRALRVIGVSHYPAESDFQAQIHVEAAHVE